MKKVLLINGRPKEKGCTYTALCEVEKSLNQNDIETQIIHIGTRPVRGCIACQRCREIKKCAFNDDMANEIASLISQADGVVIGSPVYYAGANGALCALLDRAFYSCSKNFYNKPAAAIVSCRRGGAGSAFDRLNKYFTISNMPIVSSQYWNAVHGNTPQEVLQDKEGLQIMRTLGANMAWMIKSFALADIEKPQPEKRESTNFIR